MARHRRGRHRSPSPIPVKAVRAIVGAGGLGVLGWLWLTDNVETPVPEFPVAETHAVATAPPTTAVTPTPPPTPPPSRAKASTTRSTPSPAPSTTEDPEPEQDEEEVEGDDDGGDRSAVVKSARSFLGLGIPYVWGGKTLAGMDCSGYIWRVLQKAGYDVPYRDSRALRSWTIPISAGEARPGDLVFWPGHAAIYAGGGRIYDSGSTSSGVTERNMWGGARFGRIPTER